MNRLATLLLSLLTAGVAPAASLTVLERTEQAPEMGTLRFLEIRHDQAQYTLVPPHGWRLNTDVAAAQLKFSEPKANISMALQFHTNEARQVLATTDRMRELAVPHLSGATVLEDFPNSGSGGRSLVLAYLLHGRPMRARVAVLPLDRGCVTFVVACGADDFANAGPMLAALQTSFQRQTPP